MGAEAALLCTLTLQRYQSQFMLCFMHTKTLRKVLLVGIGVLLSMVCLHEITGKK